MILDPISGSCVSYSTTRHDTIIPPAHWPAHTTVTMSQPHGNQVRVIAGQVAGEPLDCDGIISTEKTLHLQVKTADCLPILLYHPSGIVGALHAGRRGTEAGILSEALSILKKQFAVVRDLQIWFGPAICHDCYQIDRATDTHYDLIAANQQQLYDAFSESDVQLRIDHSCTTHDEAQFHSYRRVGRGVPMNYSGIMLL